MWTIRGWQGAAKKCSGLPEAVRGHGKAIEELSGVQAALMRAVQGFQKGGQVLPGIKGR